MALTKVVNERDSSKATIKWIEDKIVLHATTPISELKVSEFLTTIEIHRTKAEDQFQRIIGLVSDADLPPHTIAYTDLLDRILELKDQLTQIDKTFPKASSSSTSTSSTSHTATTAKIRLPQLELPTFDGTLQEWVSFRDMFVSTVSNNPSLSKSQQLTYLKAQLKGEAARQLSSLTISDANFDIAWSQLTERYQNERELFFAILRRFLSQPTVLSQSASSIRQLIDVSQECIRSLDVLKLPTKEWDAILLYLIITKMDPSSKELWEHGLKDSSIPKLKVLFEFLEQRARALSASGTDLNHLKSSFKSAQGNNSSQGEKRNNRFNNKPIVHHTNAPANCNICEESSHPIFRCEKFLGWSIQQRADAIRNSRSCFNCLREGHTSSQCPSNKCCRTCKAKHHTLLHRGQSQQQQQQAPKPPERATPVVHLVCNNPASQDVPIAQCSTSIRDNAPVIHFTQNEERPNEYDTLLATAVVQVQDKFGHYHNFRVLADNGSNTNFVTDSCIRKIGALKKRCVSTATGLGGSSVATTTGLTSFTVSPHFDKSISFQVSRCHVTNKITGKLPMSMFDHNRWSHLQNLQLADPGYHQPADVDMLLGAEFFFAIIKGKIISGAPNSPVALDTSFGWLIGGGSVPLITPQVHTTLTSDESTLQSNSTTTCSDLDTTLRKYWEIENEPLLRLPTPEESKAETHFVSTHKRNSDGRFIVKLPFKTPRLPLGSSLKMATKRLQLLERRLQRLPQYRSDYTEFMQQYEALGHMKEVTPTEPDKGCYLPHHFVLKESSTTTKFRVVFDASAKTSSGFSLNDTLLIGPTIQDTLVDILLRFRLHKIAFTADIAKMYRQILVDPNESHVQRILWREDPTQPIKHYELLTVTYGTGPAPFLATRVLQELAVLEQNSFSRASEVALRDFYVDDLMSGEPTEEDALATQSELLQLMKSGCLSLRKWSSNSEALLESLPPNMRETNSLLELDIDPSIKALGICWNPKEDNFIFKISKPDEAVQSTKRMVLSEIAKLFDPIGWLGPVMINAKIMMQSLWKINLGWDDKLPHDVQQQWSNFRSELQELNHLSIKRFYFANTPILCPSLNVPLLSAPKFCLVGFCDASEKAYAATTYLCAYYDTYSSVSLITSKTRVAPSKQVSLPRLELCGAGLLADLISSVKVALHIPFHSITAYTDSTVTLSWIQSHPSRWKTFVANRVSKIQALTTPESWRYVPSEENPADCASRGLTPSDLINHHLWWTGPTWLQSGPNQSVTFVKPDHFQTEEEARVLTCHVLLPPETSSRLERYSSLIKLVRVTAFTFRFIRNIRSKGLRPTLKSIIPLTTDELDMARNHWIKIIQQQCFREEIKALKKGKSIPKESKLISLTVFLDSNGILRVGGRLTHSQLNPDTKQPIVLPYHSRFTQLLIEEEHKKYLHAGPQTLMTIIQRRYWIIRARDAIRFSIRKCIVCTRHRAQVQQQLMADLPSFRVNQARPFLKTGVDYAGPFLIRPIQPRSKITIKAYLAVFVCCVTRAIHLELVSSLSTDAFLAAFRRFVARRGRPSDMFSDNGTNFVGADNEMKDMLKLVQSEFHNNTITDCLSKDGTSWHFQPPGAPHHNGLNEAGVKSVKYHLRRIMGTQRFTFEELTTVLAQIEAILNSRPITPESSDPNDLSALTPGHFLVGAPLTAIPEPSLEKVPMTRLSRWQLTQQIVQSFWKRWSNEYLTRLQHRPKWIAETKSIAPGDLVLIKEENLPPLQWKLARVLIIHPGADGLVRVVTLKTSSGELKRPITKICLLPVDAPSLPPSVNNEPSSLKSFYVYLK